MLIKLLYEVNLFISNFLFDLETFMKVLIFCDIFFFDRIVQKYGKPLFDFLSEFKGFFEHFLDLITFKFD